MFLEQAMRRSVGAPCRMLDLCAAPGGRDYGALSVWVQSFVRVEWGFTVGPATKGTEKPAPSEEDAGFVVPPARFLPGVGCSAVVFLPKRRPGCPFALPCRASRALDSAAPQVPKRPRYAPLPRCSAPGASFMAAAGGEHTTPTSGGWNSAGGPCACGERLPPHILPNLSATIPLPGFPSAAPCACPGAASCPASLSAQGVCKNIPHFP